MTTTKKFVTRCFTCEEEDRDKDKKKQRRACWWTKTTSQAETIKGIHVDNNLTHEVVVREI